MQEGAQTSSRKHKRAGVPIRKNKRYYSTVYDGSEDTVKRDNMLVNPPSLQNTRILIRQVHRTFSQSYIDISRSLANVGVFAGGFTFGTLFTLSPTRDNYEYLGDLLAIAFLFFATSLFLSIGIQHLLRHDEPDQPPSARKRLICKLHTYLICALIMGGFTVLNIILMNIGRKAHGIAGIVLLGFIPVWYVLVSYAEETGNLELRAKRQIAVDAGRNQRAPEGGEDVGHARSDKLESA
jgi:hypothetical protein